MFAHYFLNASVRRKLVMMLVLVTLAASATLSLGFFLYGYHTVRQTLVQELMLLGEIIGKADLISHFRRPRALSEKALIYWTVINP